MLTLEPLERRDAPASITLDAGVLTLVGTDGNDGVVVRALNFNGPKIYVTMATQNADGSWSPTLPSRLFDAALVNSIEAHLGAGNDSFSNYSALASVAYGDDGDDVFYGGRSLDVFFGGAGNDSIRAFSPADLFFQD